MAERCGWASARSAPSSVTTRRPVSGPVSRATRVTKTLKETLHNSDSRATKGRWEGIPSAIRRERSRAQSGDEDEEEEEGEEEGEEDVVLAGVVLVVDV